MAKNIQVRTAASIFTCQVIRLAQDFLKHNCYPRRQPQVIFRPGECCIENNKGIVCFLFFSSVEGISLERCQCEIMRMYTQIKEITETFVQTFLFNLQVFLPFYRGNLQMNLIEVSGKPVFCLVAHYHLLLIPLIHSKTIYFQVWLHY